MSQELLSANDIVSRARHKGGVVAAAADVADPAAAVVKENWREQWPEQPLPGETRGGLKVKGFPRGESGGILRWLAKQPESEFSFHGAVPGLRLEEETTLRVVMPEGVLLLPMALEVAVGGSIRLQIDGRQQLLRHEIAKSQACNERAVVPLLQSGIDCRDDSHYRSALELLLTPVGAEATVYFIEVYGAAARATPPPAIAAADWVDEASGARLLYLPFDPARVVNHGALAMALGGGYTGDWVCPLQSGMVRVTTSGERHGAPEAFVAQSFEPDNTVFFCKTRDDQPPPSITLELRPGISCSVDGYSFFHRSGVNKFFVRTWRLEGKPVGSSDFVPILEHYQDSSIREGAPFGYWDAYVSSKTVTSHQLRRWVTAKQEEFYHTFRLILAPRGNSSRTNALVATCFEIYGTVQKQRCAGD